MMRRQITAGNEEPREVARGRKLEILDKPPAHRTPQPGRRG